MLCTDLNDSSTISQFPRILEELVLAIVSIVMPLYNKADFAGRAINSILAQTRHDFEIVLVDDGSTGNGQEIVKFYKDPRLRLIHQPDAGPGAAKNRGVKESSSRYVAFLDADDEYLPEFLQTSITNLENNPDCVLSACNHYRGPDKTPATAMFPFNSGIDTGPWRLPPDCEPGVLWGSLMFMQSWATVCRRDVFLEYGGFYERHCTYADDQYLWLQLLLNRKIYRDTIPYYWHHSGNNEPEMWSRTSMTPVWSFLTDPDPIRKACSPEYRRALERMFSYAAVLCYSYVIPDESNVSFWRDYLKGIPDVHDLPLDRPRPRERSAGTGRLSFEIDEEVSARVCSICVERSITPEIFFLACLAFLIWKHSTQETIVIGSLYPNREQEEIQGMFGCYIRTIPLRFDVSGSSTVAAWLEYVKNQYINAWAHTSIGPDELIDLAGVSRTTNANAICQIVLAFDDDADGKNNARTSADRDISGNDLAFCLIRKRCFEGTLWYSADLFDADSVEMLAVNFTRVVRALSGGYDSRLGHIELMDARARDLVNRINSTENPAFMGLTFLDLFRESLQIYRESIAVKTSDGSFLSYGELDQLSDEIARRLIDGGAEEGSLIGLYMNRDQWLLPSFLGVFKAGAAYVPLNPDFPLNRNTDIIKEAGIQFIATISALESESAMLGPYIRIICVNADSPLPGIKLPAVRPDQTAYVLFTSGSTGKPKGVPIRHDSIANLLQSMRSVHGLSHDDVVLALATFTFDMSTPEFYLPLVCGANLVLVDNATSLDTAKLISLIEREGITFMQATPSRWMLLLETGWKGSPGMTIITGGEALHQELAGDLLETGATVWNMYGPTETTVWSSACRVQQGDAASCIGIPIANTGFFVLDRNDRLLPAGIPGELGISGAGLSEGYLYRPDLTSRRFVEIDDGGIRRRVYKTGDLVQQRSSGDFRYFGRNDFQVKIRGYRIELGEIESVMRGFPDIKEAVCAVWVRSEHDKRIVAYYRADSGIHESVLKSYIKKSLPDYMVPGHFMALTDFPRTSSGKTDRKSLPLPSVSGEPAAGKVPATSLQEQILTIWKEVVGCEDIGIDESFFDLGGHSLLAVELVRRLNARLNGKWKLRDLFENPTIEGLAGLLGSNTASRMPLVFKVNKQDKGTPLFLVAGTYTSNYSDDEEYSSYEHDFLRYFNNILLILGNERPIYGLRPRGIYRGEKFHATVEEMAAEYIKEIKAIQPNGPYLIGGECFGGFVAHSMACQLKEHGDAVSKLVLLDTDRIWLGKEISIRLYDYLRDIKRIALATYRSLRYPDFSRETLRRIGEKALILFFPIVKSLREKRYLELGSRKYVSLLLHYRPKRYDGKTLLVINEEWNESSPSLGWNSDLLPDLDIRIVPGNHMTRLEIGNDALARCLSSLNEAIISMIVFLEIFSGIQF